VPPPSGLQPMVAFRSFALIITVAPDRRITLAFTSLLFVGAEFFLLQEKVKTSNINITVD